MPKNHSNPTTEEAVNELLNFASPKILQDNLLVMYESYCETANADCITSRTQATNVFGSLIRFFGKLKPHYKFEE